MTDRATLANHTWRELGELFDLEYLFSRDPETRELADRTHELLEKVRCMRDEWHFGLLEGSFNVPTTI